MMTEIDAATATFLIERELISQSRVVRLAGGVSGETYLLETPSERIVVKRALSQLTVATDWTAKPERAMTEAAAIELVHALTPDTTPRLREADPVRNIIVMDAAPADWIPWKSALLDPDTDPTHSVETTAAHLGTVLGTWHARTWHDNDLARRFNDYEALDQLRIAPFHRAIRRVHPSVADAVDTCIRDLETTRQCLVHGDFSPKNILVGQSGLMVLDFEVAHFGAAVFDLAFMHCHLILKALHLPEHADRLAIAASAFSSAHRAAIPTASARAASQRHLGWHVACLLLARVDGQSPATYLRPETATVVRTIALDLLHENDPSIARVWNHAMEVRA